jgi:SDR family mycofactocin-dependent oxidoreductase
VGRVEGKVAFVTGAARGQGRAEAVRLAEEGADILAIDVPQQVELVAYETGTSDDLAETVKQVEATGRRIVAKQVDVRDLPGMTSFVNDGVAELGKLDIVVGNAGICIAGPWRDQTPDVWQTTLDVNLTGVYNTVMASVEHLLANGQGSVILTSSSNGIKPGPFNLAYTAAKLGVVGIAKAFAMELAKDHIRVNSIHPGPVESGMYGAFVGMEKGRAENPNLWGMLSNWMPGHMDPREIANLVLYLASDESRYATGAMFAVDGGQASY